MVPLQFRPIWTRAQVAAPNTVWFADDPSAQSDISLITPVLTVEPA